MTLLAKFKGPGGNSVLGIVERSLDFAEHDFLLTQMSEQPKGDMVPVRVINPSPAPTLYHSTSIGTFGQLEDGTSQLQLACN